MKFSVLYAKSFVLVLDSFPLADKVCLSQITYRDIIADAGNLVE